MRIDEANTCAATAERFMGVYASISTRRRDPAAAPDYFFFPGAKT
jgi:hypothetical protein